MQTETPQGDTIGIGMMQGPGGTNTDLRKQEERLRAIFQSIPIPTYTWQRVEDEFILTDYNQAAQEITQGGIAEVVGFQATELYRDRPDILDDFTRCWEERGTFEREMEYHFHTTGERKHLFVRYAFVHPDMIMVHTTDISERVRAESQRDATLQELRESQARYQDLYENAPSANFSVGVDGRVLRCNRRAVDMLGYPHDQLIGKAVIDLYADTPQGKKAASRLFQRFLDGEEITGETLQMTHADGTLLWISLTVNVVLDEHGEVLESRSMVVDITERVRARELLRMEKERAQAYLHIAEVVLLALDINGAITLINQKGCDLLGYAEEELVGRNWFDLARPVGMREEAKGAFQRLMAGEVQVAERYKIPVVTRSGKQRLIAWHNTVLRDKEGNITGTLSSGEDITEREQAQADLQQYTRQLETLNTVTAALSTSLALDEVLDLILEKLAAVLAYDSASVFLIEAGRLWGAACRGVPYPEQVIEHTFPLDGELFWQITASGAAMTLVDAQADTRFQRWGGADHVRGWLGVPLLARGEIIGFLTIDSRQTGAYGEAQAALVQPFANQAAQAIENARLHQHVQRQALGLEDRVAERTAELQRLVDLMAGREVRMADLKEVIRKLRAQLQAAGLEPVADDPLLGEYGSRRTVTELVEDER